MIDLLRAGGEVLGRVVALGEQAGATRTRCRRRGPSTAAAPDPSATSTWNSSPSTVMRSPLAVMSAFRLPRIESYLSRCASVSASVRSLTATMSIVVVVHGRAHDVAADAAEPVDADLDGHCRLSSRQCADRRCVNLDLVNVAHGQTDARIAYGGTHASTTCTPSTASSSSRSASSCRPGSLYQAIRYRKYIGSLPQRMGYLPVSASTSTATSRSGFMPSRSARC